MSVPKTGEWVDVGSARNDIDASLLGGLLEQAGIPYQMVHTNSAPGAWLTGVTNPMDPLRVMVPEEHLEEARAVLEVLPEEPAGEATPVERSTLIWVVATVVLVAIVFAILVDARRYWP